MEFSHCVQHLHGVGGAAIVRIDHGAEILRDVSAEIKTEVVERECVGSGAASGIGMLIASLYSSPNSQRGFKGLRR